MKRLTLELPPKAIKALEILRQWGDVADNAQVFIKALSLLDMVREETDKGSEVIIRRADGTEIHLNIWT